MAHVPRDDAEQLFRETNPKTWDQLQRVLQQHKGKAEGIRDNLIDLLIPMCQDFARSGKPFPNSDQELESALNQALATTGHGGRP